MLRVLLSALLPALALAQTPAFEVASIRPSPALANWSGFQLPGGERFQASHVTLKAMIAYAYEVREFTISGGPGWASSELFEIEAKVPGEATAARARAMMRTVLEERFKLAVRRETKDTAVYQLVVAKGIRPKLEESTEGGFLKYVGRGQVEGHGYPMSGLAKYLESLLRQPVLEKTGLTARYNFKLNYTPDETQAALPVPAGVATDAPSLYAALQEQLGLKLEPAKGPVEFIVIDHAESLPRIEVLMKYAVLAVMLSWIAYGQSATPAFDVATVKLADPREPLDIRTSPGGRLTVTNQPLKNMIKQAYGVESYQISGGPAWLDTERFDVEAKAEGNPDHAQVMRLFQTLLEDRFQLKVRRAQREGAIYALTAARGGPKLTAAAELKTGERAGVFNGRTGAPTATALSYWKQGRHATIAMLANSLEGTLGRPVRDRTEIAGEFDFRFEYAADELSNGDFPSLFTAVQDQLGLKLESTRGSVETLVVERAEKPSAN
ncbi:MAG TPA: TIGR03435 family protein [Bryobacteraceae bacterium]|jgi:uncharacterized protein (TIGR03435 family)